jgi:HEAT repeat protein
VANPYIAGNALLALARLGDQQISSRLLEMLQHPNEYIRVQAVRAVALLRYEPAGAIILQMLARLRTDRDAKGSTRHAMVNHLFEAVGALGLNDAVPTLVEIARQDVGLRGKAVETLIALQAEEAAAPLAHMLADPSSSLRRNLLVLMDTFQYRPAIPFIRPLLNDGLPSIRRAALQALTKMGDRESAAQIEWMAFHDSSPFVRVEAVEALAQLQGAEAMAAMHALANDPNADVRRAVVSSLIRFNTWNEAELRIAARFAADFPNDPLSEQIRPVLANQLPLPPDAGPMPVLETVPGLPPAMTDQRDQLAGLLEDWLAGLPAGSASEATRAALQHLLALLK